MLESLLIGALSSLLLFGMYCKAQQYSGLVTQGAASVGNSGRKKKGILYQQIFTGEIAGLSASAFFVVVLLLAFVLRAKIAVMYKGYDVDMNCFLSWADMVFENGVGGFYSLDAFTDYPPGYMYILYVIGAIRAVFGIEQGSDLSILLTKMPAILCDMATGFLIFTIAKKKMKPAGAAIVAGIFLITPAIVMDSTIWGQVDSVFTLFVVLMCYLVTERKLIPAYFVFAVGILIKPQTLIFTPVLIFGIIDQVFLDLLPKDKEAFKKAFFKNLGFGLLAIGMIGLLMVPFGFGDALKQYTETLGSYPYASVNAFNFWTVIGRNWSGQSDIFLFLPCQVWGMLSIFATVAAAVFINFKCRDRQSKYYFLGAFIVTGMFVLSVRMHERYIYPAMALVLLCYALRPMKKFFTAYLWLALGSLYNMIWVMFFYDPNDFSARVDLESIHTVGEAIEKFFPLVVSAAMVLFFCYMVSLAVTFYLRQPSEGEEAGQIAREYEALPRFDKLQRDTDVIKPSVRLPKMLRLDWIILAVVTLVYGIIAFVNLGNREAPETNYSFVKQGPVLLDFGESVQMGKLWDYLGYQNNPKYTVSYSDVPQGPFTTVLFSDSDQWDAGAVFRWNQFDLNIQARYLRIEARPEQGGDSIHELVILDNEGNALLPANASEYPALFDEQELFEGRESWRNGTYFDEIYHARTAYEMIHDLYCYENTHPPLGKIFIACGVLLFGMNPFGWRFMGTLFGVMMLPVFYIFAKKLFDKTWLSGLVTVLFACDFMHFTQTRIATIDVFVTFFIILAYYFMYCYTRTSFYDTELKKTFLPLGLCGVIMGISWACKWTGIYASGGLCILFFLHMAQRYREYRFAKKNPRGETAGISHQSILESFKGKFVKTILFCCGFYLAIPAAIYTLSYLPVNDGTERGLIARMIANQTGMFSYHSDLDSTHPYSSKWYEWPIIKRPMWYFDGQTPDDLREGISAFGNPLIWWVGLAAFGLVVYLAVSRWDRRAIFLALGYLSQYLPWLKIGRVVFIYHYFPSVPFVVLMIGYCMWQLVEWKPKLVSACLVYGGAAVALFALFYPVLSGMAITPDYANHYLKWFDSWVLLRTW